MLSKFLRQSYRRRPMMLLAVKGPQKTNVRKFIGYIPPSQYDTPIPKRLKIPHVMAEYWETIPLFLSTFIALGVMVAAIINAVQNKVDVVFTTHSRSNLSRTMDLRHPQVAKLITINQRYDPWPEMANSLEKMDEAEKRALARLKPCNP